MKFKLFVFIFLLFTAVACNVEEEPTPLEMPPTPLLNPAVSTEAANSDATAALLQPTPTIAPTITPSIVPQMTATTSPTVMDGLPAANSDLLFIADGAFKWWRHDLGQIVTLMAGGTAVSPEESSARTYNPLISDITALSISDDGKQAIIAQLISESFFLPNPDDPYTDTVGTYQIIHFDFNSKQQHLMFPTLHSYDPPEISISPDGQNMTVAGLGIDTVEELKGLSGTVLYVRETAVGTDPKIVEQCAGGCRGIIWHTDNNLFVYGNQDGLKMYNISASAPELLLDGDVSDEFQFGRHFTPLSWANNGRYLLTWYSAGIEGGERAIFDMPTKQLMSVPNSSAYIGPFAQLTWMYDTRLFLVRMNENNQAIGETLRVDIDNNQVVLDETVLLSQDQSYPAGPKHWQDGRFAYALFNIDDNFDGITGSSSGAYQRISFNEDAQRLNDVPVSRTFYPEIAWSKDGSDLVVGDLGTMWYIPASGGEIVNMETAVGPAAHSFNWRSPTP